MDELAQKRKRHKRLPLTMSEKLTPAERSKRYREGMKKNTKKYEQFLQKERDRKKASWRTRTTEQIMEDRRRARERQKRFHEKRKMMGITVTGKSTDKKAVLTRSEREKQREYWRRKLAGCRARKSTQKQRRYKEKDKKYHQQKGRKVKQNQDHKREDNAYQKTHMSLFLQ